MIARRVWRQIIEAFCRPSWSIPVSRVWKGNTSKGVYIYIFRSSNRNHPSSPSTLTMSWAIHVPSVGRLLLAPTVHATTNIACRRSGLLGSRTGFGMGILQTSRLQPVINRGMATLCTPLAKAVKECAREPQRAMWLAVRRLWTQVRASSH
jgi:hypothetical protein